jgi:hypothetical protein
MSFLDKLKNSVQYAERWAGRRLGEFSNKTGRKIADFAQKTSKKVGDFAQKAAAGLELGAISSAAVPVLGEYLAPALESGAGIAERIALGADVVGNAARQSNVVLNKLDKVGADMRKNKYTG